MGWNKATCREVLKLQKCQLILDRRAKVQKGKRKIKKSTGWLHCGSLEKTKTWLKQGWLIERRAVTLVSPDGGLGGRSYSPWPLGSHWRSLQPLTSHHRHPHPLPLLPFFSLYLFFFWVQVFLCLSLFSSLWKRAELWRHQRASSDLSKLYSPSLLLSLFSSFFFSLLTGVLFFILELWWLITNTVQHTLN